MNFLERRLEELRSRGVYRSLGGSVAGVDFWSNDYLGLARLTDNLGEGPQDAKQFLEKRAAVPRFISGATGSRSISGDDDRYHLLESAIAEYHGYPAALVYASGYLANLGLLSALGTRTDTFLYDELVHASVRDGMRMSPARSLRFAHNDVEDLQRQLGKVRPDGEVFVLTEGRFSMDGDLAPLEALSAVCQQFGAHLIVDEAHSGGLEGKSGAGLVADRQLQSQVFATLITYGKAFGAHGAAVLGAPTLREYLINRSRAFIYTTGPAPAQWAGIEQAYQKLSRHHAGQYAALQRITEHFQRLAKDAGLNRFLAAGASGPIQPLVFGDSDRVMELEAACRSAGYLVKGIRHPTVARGEERIRICLHAFNTEAEVAGLIGVLGHG
ncbi:pyridoxal phosphate-dependent aminotransferase family protein [Lewinella sp. W8]|uniref:aminotransferase class I/II-fold pyridoxal phosphate-dependent enzyme n=1 Tax=Lewinella sp. W8 TaxID=2528208 RepID=UPI0010673728|nr:pyridoxal phosphate-dependent aminotransferase family protein [Lewinella sp. W8]MTB50798.1 aminotransferase class I/II-fold pyridoxal phosphate-dependent enzyme [Lewinella sp. W8]